jgi:hypothetical protein
MLNLHHTEVIQSTIVDWIEPITLKKHNLQLFSATECARNNILKNAIIIDNVVGSIFSSCCYSVVCCGYKWATCF